MVLQSTSFSLWPRSTTQFNVKYARGRRQWGKFIIFLLYFTLLLHLINIVCVEYTPSKFRVKVFYKILLYIQLSCHGTLPSLLKYSTNCLLISFPVSWWFLLFPFFGVAMFDGLFLKPSVTVPCCRSSVSKHSDGVYVSGDVLRKKLCSAQLAITTSLMLSNWILIWVLNIPNLATKMPKTFSVILRAQEGR